MNEEQYKKLSSDALRKTLKELNLSTLNALGAAICVLNVMFEFVEDHDIKLNLEKFLQQNTNANMPIFAIIDILFEKLEENMSSLARESESAANN
jgi:hypothetical protein